MARFTMKELPVDDRPYEKLEKYGASALSNAELLAIVLKTGTRDETSIQVAQKVLKECSDIDESIDFKRLSSRNLMNIKGIGRVKSILLEAVFELSNRINANNLNKVQLRTPKDINRLVAGKLRYEKQEIIMVLVLNVKCELIKSEIISKGDLNSASALPRNVLSPAVEYGSKNVIIVHNHPSGDPTPSEEDISFTRNIVSVGKILEIDVLDHIIIGSNRYVSFREKKLI